ncbi:MAG: hypothetical protein ACE37J_19900 [Pikeienuella sp.]|uniref:hypothetical protein n=1 Tax=Pikeienuella sp. TaxID=2831957 RepID=UPI00391AD408
MRLAFGLRRGAGSLTASALAALLGFATPLAAATVTLEQHRAFDVAVDGGTAGTLAPPLVFDRFDGALGLLTRVEIALSAGLTGFAVDVSNPNPFDLRFKTFAQLDTVLKLEDRSLIGWFQGAKTKDWSGALGGSESVTISYSPATLAAFAFREGATMDSFEGSGEIAFSLAVMPRFGVSRRSIIADLTSCAPEDQAACDAGTVTPLSVAVSANGSVSGGLTLRYVYQEPPPAVSNVPLPASGPLLVLGLGLLALRMRRRR